MKRLKLKHETVRLLANNLLRMVAAGESALCGEQSKSLCNVQGCNTGAGCQ
jgi:hypothetical protein